MSMACLSPSPSGRRLSELLEEKQEPFFLDLHLLEKGCSSRLLDGYDTALCWPAGPATDAAAVLKRLTSKKNKTVSGKNKQPAGLLRVLLSKILHGKSGRKPAALQLSDSFKMSSAGNPAAVAPYSVKHLDTTKLAGVKERDATAERCYYSDSDCEYEYESDDEKQLSPVSVLEHPFETSPAVHGKLLSSPSRSPAKIAGSAMVDVLRELTQLLAKSDDLLKDTAADDEDDDDDDCYYGGYRTSPKNRRGDDAAYWKAHRAELAAVSELVAAEVPSARLVAAADLRTEREDVGAGVAAAVIDALLQELVVDLGSCRC